jgi:voltage-gated potassium channel
MQSDTDPKASQPLHPSVRVILRALYHGTSRGAVRFRLAVIGVDLAIIGFFIVSPVLRGQGALFYVADYLIAAVLAVDMCARALTYRTLRDWLKEPVVWSDLIVLGTLLLPTLALNFGFLRVLRLWSLVNSDFFWRTVGRRYDDTRIEDVVKAVGALITFVFVATGFIYAAFIGRTEGIEGYVDALYFTVTSLTTTGYGDIVLGGAFGKLASIAIMLVGVTLFVRLGQSLIAPRKINFTCGACGLSRHEPDAQHCKSCGARLEIPDDRQ